MLSDERLVSNLSCRHVMRQWQQTLTSAIIIASATHVALQAGVVAAGRLEGGGLVGARQGGYSGAVLS